MPFFLNNSLSPVSATHMYMDVEQSTEHGQPNSGCSPPPKYDSPSPCSYILSIALQLDVALGAHL